MATGNLVKRLQNIMRQDPGISGDAQRIEQMVWIFFLKVYDAQEREWEFVASSNGKKFLSIIPERFRWRNWAVSKDEEGKERGDILTGDSLLAFINELFAALKSLEITPETPRSKAIVKEVFADLNQYQKNGILLRQIVNIVDEIDFSDAQDRHTFGDIYEQILKDLQGAGRAGEFYTPRAVTDFIISRLNPRIGQTIGDFASGTGGFLVSGLRHLQDQIKTIEDEEKYQNSIIGQEWKPFPYLLCITNLLVNGIESPNVRHMDSLGKRLKDWEDDCDIIAMNPPYGGSTEASVKSNFPSAFQTSETADLFILLIMQRLRRGGRAGVVIPDGFLFGTDGAKLAIKQKLLKEFNLHTIVRLPPSVFSPYTGIATNIIFFDRPESTPQDGKCATKETWVYRLDMPEGCKHFSKTKPMKIEHFAPAVEWWSNRKEIVGEEIGEKAKKFTASELAEELGYNLDQCGYPHVEEEILAPMDLIQRYQEERSSLNAEIDRVLAEITEKLGDAK